MERNDLLLPYRELAGLRDRFQAGGDKITLGSYLAGEQYGAERAPRMLVVGRALNGWLDTFCDRDAKTTLALWETQEKTGVPMPYRTVWDAAVKAYVPAPVSRCRGLGWVDTYLASGNGDRKRKTADTPFWRAARAAANGCCPYPRTRATHFTATSRGPICSRRAPRAAAIRRESCGSGRSGSAARS